ncbi:hypothetical protein EYF80_013971 [Liparis tanakae]|uniref:Uncharacterized protein n=1 Tax=Liparis tanakae TaxID=230148 RepID=A0A4Z2IEF9_9TELE|nr:hypothetical protein EYF80_013971 [Liparis tanakae]
MLEVRPEVVRVITSPTGEEEEDISELCEGHWVVRVSSLVMATRKSHHLAIGLKENFLTPPHPPTPPPSVPSGNMSVGEGNGGQSGESGEERKQNPHGRRYESEQMTLATVQEA